MGGRGTGGAHDATQILMASTHRVGIDPIVEEACERWNQCDEAEASQRELILAAKRFRAGDQWDPAIKDARAGKTSLQGVAPQPPRPCLTVDRLSGPVRLVSNQIKSSQFAIDVLPNGHGADDETAEIIKGYLRRVQNQARDESPIDWAADGATAHHTREHGYDNTRNTYAGP